MKYRQFYKSIICLSFIIFSTVGFAADDGKCKLLLVPVTTQKTELQDVADEASLIFKRKLDLGDCTVIGMRSEAETEEQETPTTSDTNNDNGSSESKEKDKSKEIPVYSPEDINTRAREEGCLWIVRGSVRSVGIDTGKKILGPAWIGYRRIPVTGVIHAQLIHVPSGRIIFDETESGTTRVPRFSFLGIHGDPLPKTPRSIDAVIHDAVIKLARGIILKIRETQQ